MPMIPEDVRAECCQNPENMEVESRTETTSAYCRVLRCKVCGLHHYGMTVKPVELGAKLAPIGKK